MQILSFLGLAAFASVTAAQDRVPLRPDLKVKYDETADWYRDHGMQMPRVASPVTVVEANRSYVVKLACPDCPFYVANETSCAWENLAPCSWREQSNALLLKFDVENAASAISTLRLNGAPVLPLAPMPLYINAYQVANNLTAGALDSLIRAGTLESDSKAETNYIRTTALQYEHTLLKTTTPGRWWIQLDITGLQYGAYPAPLHFTPDRRLVQILVAEQRGREQSPSLSIEDIQVIERSQRAQPIRMKCGKPASVQTSFDPSAWDQYGELGSWSRFWSMARSQVARYWADKVQHNALALPVALLLAFVVFFARVWCQRRLQDRATDAEYALLECECERDGVPPAYLNIPVIKVEEYE